MKIKKMTCLLEALFILGLSLIPGQARAKVAPGIPGPIPNDVLFVPPQKRPSQVPTLQEGSPQIPQERETSEYMAGRVAVGIIFPESNGTTDPSTEDWTTPERNDAISEIQKACNWWIARAPANTKLSFIYRNEGPVSTRYEPINHDRDYAQTWVADVLGKMGYSSGDHLDRAFDYDNRLKNTYNTDWAFTIFIADSSNDADGQFTDGSFAWAWLGGPYMIMTYDNANYGIDDMDAVCAHEMGHIFYAMDQYASSGCRTSDRSGYLNITNSNCENGGTSYQCIMRGGVSPYTSGAVSTSTREQIGWRDSDSDGVLDIFDLPSQTNLTVFTPDPTTDSTPTYSGSASIVEAYPNNNPKSHYGAGGGNDLNIDNISGVQYRYRLGAGSWSSWQSNSTAADGAFDEQSENFSFTAPTLADGTYTFEVKAATYFGSEDSSPATDTLTIASNDLPTCTLTSPSALTWYRGTITLSASASDPDGTIALVEFDYSLDHASWFPCSGSPDTSQPFSLNWTSIPSTGVDPTVWLRTRSKDNEAAYSGYDEQQIKIDNEAPSTTDDYNGAWYNQDFTINITGNDGSGSGLDNSNIRYRINGGVERNLVDHGQPVILVEDGDNQLEYWAIDRVGNEESPHNLLIRIKLDKTGPLFGPYALTPSDLTEKTLESLTVSLTVSDTLSGAGVPQLDYRLDSTAYDGYEVMTQGEGNTWSFSIPPPGDWADHQEETLYWRIRCEDLAGNEAIAKEGSEFIEAVNDTPTCRITSPDSFTWQAGEIVIMAEATDDEAMDSVEFTFSLDGQDWQDIPGSPVTSPPYQLTWNTSPTDGADTEVYLMARAWDLTGLDSGWDTVIIRVDNQPPQTFASADTFSWHTFDITIMLEAGDGVGAGVLDTCYQINEGETKGVSINGLPVISAEGDDNSLTYWSLDQMGNQEAPKFLSGLKLDKTPPGILSWFLDPKDLTEDTIGPLETTVIVEEVLSGLTGVEFDWRIGEAAYDGYEAMRSDGGSTWSATIPEPELWDNERGKNIYLRIRAIDAAGNTGSEEITELIDSINDPPTCQLIYPAEPDWHADVIEIQAEAEDQDNAIDRVEFQYYRQGIWEDCARSPVSAGSGTVYSLNWPSQPSDGLDTGVVLRVRAVDKDGLASEYDTGSIWVDNQPPVTTAVYEDIWHSEAFHIPLVATDGAGVGVETTTYRINSGPEIHDSQPLIDLEGTNNRLSCWSIDKLGNQELPKSLTGIKLDLTPPLISDWVKYPPDLTEDSVGPLTVYVSVTDTLSGHSGIPQFDYRLGSQAYDGWEDMTSQGGKRYLFSIPEPGLWDDYRGETISFKVKATDVAGNIIESLDREELIDSINDPPFCWLTSLEADNWYGGQVTLSAEAVDSDGEIAGVEFAYSLSGEWTDLPLVSEPPYQLKWDSQPETGVETTVKIRVRSEDNEGAYSNYDQVQIRIDNEAPLTSHNYDGTWQTQDFTITLTAEDGDGSGVAAIYYRLNEGEEKNVAAHGQPIITVEDDHNILEYWSVDAAGNQELPRMLTGIKLDKSPPPSPIALTADGENPSPWKNSSSFIIDWTDPADLSGIAFAHYRLGLPPEGEDSGESTTFHPFEVLSTQSGGQMLYLWLEDALGQLDCLQMASVELRYETTPPAIGAFSTDPVDLTEDSSGAFQIEVEVVDEGGSGLAHVELSYQIDASGWSEFLPMNRVPQPTWSPNINPQSAIPNPQSPIRNPQSPNTWAFDIPEPDLTWDSVRGQTLSWQVKATDQAGNITFSSTREELVDDINDPPTCSWVQPEGNTWLGGELKLEIDGRDQDGEIDRVFIQVSLDNGLKWSDVLGSPITSPPYNMNWDSLPAPGVNSNVILRAMARDDEGDYSVWAERSIKVDNQAPETVADYEPGWHRKDFIIELTADDGQGSGVKDIYYQINDDREKRVSLDGQPNITTEGPANTLVYWATDQVGQKKTKKIEGIGLDKTVPTIIEINQEPEDLTEHFGGDLIVRVTVRDEGGSGISDGELQIADCSDCGLQISDFGLQDADLGWWAATINPPAGGWEPVAGKDLIYRIKVEDGAGNVTLSPEQIEPIEDAPTITLLTPTAEGVVVKDSYRIRWEDEDLDNDAIVSLFYQNVTPNSAIPTLQSPIRNPQSAIRHLIVSGLSEDDETDSYHWDTSGVEEGQYRILAEISDGRFTSDSLSPGFIRVDHTPPALEWVTANQDGFTLHLAEETLPLRLEDAVFTVTEADTPTITHPVTTSYLDENDSRLVHLEAEMMIASVAYILKVDGIKDMVGNQTPPVIVNDIIFADPTKGNTITRSDGTGLDIPAGTFDEQVTLLMNLAPSSPELEEADRAAGSDPAIGYLVPESVREYRVIGKDGGAIPSDGFNHPVRVTIPYSADLPVNELDLLIYRLDGVQWVMAGRVINRDRDKHTLTAEVPYLSVFRVAEYVPLPADDLSKVIIYPTLFKASQHEAVVFEGLKEEGVEIHIFNLAGQLIKTAKPSESRWRWWVKQERPASGVYIYRLTDGKTKRAGRLVIIK